MLKNLLGRVFASRSHPVHADVPVYAIGDVHGRADLLVPLVERIVEDALTLQDLDGSVPEIVFVGDMVDRGPDSRGVLDIVARMRGWTDARTIVLAGNHEAMLLGFLEDPVRYRRWLRYGGLETLESYGVPVDGAPEDPDVLARAADALAEAMGDHVDLLRACEHSHLNGNLLFTHAGADPALPPWNQSETVLLWGTPEFLTQTRDDGLWVVYGHNVVARAQAARGRIAIDTGAYASGELTALRVVGDDLSFLSQKDAR